MRRQKLQQLTLKGVGGGILAGVLASHIQLANAQATDSNAFSLEEIVVTARKREESSFDVPMSLDVFSGSDIESSGIENSTDFVGRVPGLSTSGDFISPGKDFVYLVTRGVGANTGGDPATPVFLDGVYQPRLAFDTGFMAVQRIEILKGPQGSVFGRNSEGGAINIVTQRPDDEFSGRIRLEYDDFSGHKTQASVNLPISDTLFSSIAIESQTIGSYLDNNTIGRQNQGKLEQSAGSVDADGGVKNSARFALSYEPSDDFSAYFTIDYSQFEGLNGLPGVARGCDCYEVNTEFQIDAHDLSRGSSLHLEWDLNWADLTSISGYRFLSTKLPFDFDGGTRFTDSIHDFRSEQEFWSEELRLSNSTESSSWLVGLYYFEETLDSQRGYDLPNNPTLPGLFIIDQDVKTDRKGYAVFANTEFELTPSLALTVGGRYSSEDIDGDFHTDYTIESFDLHVIDQDQESDSFESLTGTLSLKYYWNDDIVNYLTVSQGFKAGGYPIAPISAVDFVAFSEEKSTNYEIGLKADFLDNRVKLEAAIFHIELEDQQLSTIIEVNNLPVASTANAGESHINGAEFELNAALTEALVLRATMGYTDSEFDDYVDVQGLQRAGENFRFTPEYTASLGLDYGVPITSDKELVLSLNYRFVDEIQQGFGGTDPEFAIDSYQLLDVSASIISDQWQLQLFVDNLTDEYIETRAWDAFFFSINKSDSFSSVLPPRKIGLRLSYDF